MSKKLGVRGTGEKFAIFMYVSLKRVKEEIHNRLKCFRGEHDTYEQEYLTIGTIKAKYCYPDEYYHKGRVKVRREYCENCHTEVENEIIPFEESEV